MLIDAVLNEVMVDRGLLQDLGASRIRVGSERRGSE
jgi:hypothetical protein